MSSGSKYNIVWKNLILFFVSNLSYLLVYIFIVEMWKLIYLFTNLEVTFKIFQCPLEFELKTGFFINVYVIDDHFKFWFFLSSSVHLTFYTIAPFCSSDAILISDVFSLCLVLLLGLQCPSPLLVYFLQWESSSFLPLIKTFITFPASSFLARCIPHSVETLNINFSLYVHINIKFFFIEKATQVPSYRVYFLH